MLLLGLLVLCSAWTYASGLVIRGDFVDLLPTDSPTAGRFRSALARKGATASTLVVVAESPDPAANQRLIDAMEARLRRLPYGLFSSIEHGPGESRAFLEKWRWLFADVADLERVECELFHERASRLPGYLELGEDCDPGASNDPDSSAKRVSPLARFRTELEERLQKLDRFPTGYYRNANGTLFALILRTSSAGMGELGADGLLSDVEAAVASVDPRAFHPGAAIGLAGDIPNAVAERKALLHDVTVVSAGAVTLSLTAIALYFRSLATLLRLGLCVFTGTGLAFALAMAAYGRLNAATSFLGSMVFGNGINYTMMYLARYEELRSEGRDLDSALVGAALDSWRGTWLAALAASSAYGALFVTSFRGFREFGLIGGSGMLLCWLSTVLLLPATLAFIDHRTRPRGAARAAGPGERRPSLGRIVTTFVEKRPGLVLILAAATTLTALVPVPGYLRNPWEYDFSKLRSEASALSGAGSWSSKVTEILQTRGTPTLVLADHADHADQLAADIVERDRKLHGARFVERVETLHDFLGGSAATVDAKLDTLGHIREHLDWLIPRMTGEERELAEQWRPPADLRPPQPTDLPPAILSRFSELDGRTGTPVYVHLSRSVSQSNGNNLLAIADILENVALPSGQVPANAGRAAVFAEMIRSLERDCPSATLTAFAAVVVVSLLVTRRLAAAAAVLGSLVTAVAWTVGGAAWLDVRLNFLNFVALPLTFGIGIEYAINVHERIRVTGDVTAGVRSVGGVVALCSLTTVIGYASLLFADNRALQSLGRYAIVGEVSCLFTALVLLPSALSLRSKMAARRR